MVDMPLNMTLLDYYEVCCSLSDDLCIKGYFLLCVLRYGDG